MDNIKDKNLLSDDIKEDSVNDNIVSEDFNEDINSSIEDSFIYIESMSNIISAKIEEVQDDIFSAEEKFDDNYDNDLNNIELDNFSFFDDELNTLVEESNLQESNFFIQNNNINEELTEEELKEKELKKLESKQNIDRIVDNIKSEEDELKNSILSIIAKTVKDLESGEESKNSNIEDNSNIDSSDYTPITIRNAEESNEQLIVKNTENSITIRKDNNKDSIEDFLKEYKDDIEESEDIPELNFIKNVKENSSNLEQSSDGVVGEDPDEESEYFKELESIISELDSNYSEFEESEDEILIKENDSELSDSTESQEFNKYIAIDEESTKIEESNEFLDFDTFARIDTKEENDESFNIENIEEKPKKQGDFNDFLSNIQENKDESYETESIADIKSLISKLDEDLDDELVNAENEYFFGDDNEEPKDNIVYKENLLDNDYNFDDILIVDNVDESEENLELTFDKEDLDEQKEDESIYDDSFINEENEGLKLSDFELSNKVTEKQEDVSEDDKIDEEQSDLEDNESNYFYDNIERITTNASKDLSDEQDEDLTSDNIIFENEEKPLDSKKDETFKEADTVSYLTQNLDLRFISSGVVDDGIEFENNSEKIENESIIISEEDTLNFLTSEGGISSIAVITPESETTETELENTSSVISEKDTLNYYSNEESFGFVMTGAGVFDESSDEIDEENEQPQKEQEKQENENQEPKQELNKEETAEEEVIDGLFIPENEVYLKQAKNEKKVRFSLIASKILLCLTAVSLFAMIYYIVTILRTGNFLANGVIYSKNLLKISACFVVFKILHKIFYNRYDSRILKVYKMNQDRKYYKPLGNYKSGERYENKVKTTKDYLIVDLFIFIIVLIIPAMILYPFITMGDESYNLLTIAIDGITKFFVYIKDCLLLFFEFKTPSEVQDVSVIFVSGPISLFYRYVKNMFPLLMERDKMLICAGASIMLCIYVVSMALVSIKNICSQIVGLINVRNRIDSQKIAYKNSDFKDKSLIVRFIFKLLYFGIGLGSLVFMLAGITMEYSDYSNILPLILIVGAVVVILTLFILKLIVFRDKASLDSGLWFFPRYRLTLRFKYHKAIKEFAKNTQTDNLEEYKEEKKRLEEEKMDNS